MEEVDGTGKKVTGNIVNTIIKYKDEIESIGIDTWE